MGLLVRVLDNFEAVKAESDRWNDLWRRSDVSLPTARAELIGMWLDRFAKGCRFRAIIAEESGQFLAALPIVSSRFGKIVPVGALPRNHWSCGGELLADPSCDLSEPLTRIAEALGQLGWPLYRFLHVRIESCVWQAFLPALERAGLEVECRPSHDVKLIETPASWDGYRKEFSKSHRQRMNRLWNRLESQGQARFRWSVPGNMDEANRYLAQALEIEDSGWKGRAGTSLRRTHGMVELIEQMAKELVPRRELEFAFLELDGRPVSFQILWNSKGVLHAYKGGYDERFKRLGLGHLIIHEILRELCDTQRCRAYDCIGPNTPAIDQWIGSTYSTSQVTVAPAQWLSRAMLFTYRHCRPAKRKETTLKIAIQNGAPT